MEGDKKAQVCIKSEVSSALLPCDNIRHLQKKNVYTCIPDYIVQMETFCQVKLLKRCMVYTNDEYKY